MREWPDSCRCGRAPDDISSIVLVEEGQHYIKSDAILRIASRLALPMPLVAAALMPFPYFIKDTFYDQVGPETQLTISLSFCNKQLQQIEQQDEGSERRGISRIPGMEFMASQVQIDHLCSTVVRVTVTRP
jgi:predicted DCC family thiol-disulfide oxidoreductase YuxK